MQDCHIRNGVALLPPEFTFLFVRSFVRVLVGHQSLVGELRAGELSLPPVYLVGVCVSFSR